MVGSEDSFPHLGEGWPGGRSSTRSPDRRTGLDRVSPGPLGDDVSVGMGCGSVRRGPGLRLLPLEWLLMRGVLPLVLAAPAAGSPGALYTWGLRSQ